MHASKKRAKPTQLKEVEMAPSVLDALAQKGWKDFTLKDYRQHSIGSGSKTEAAAYVQIANTEGVQFYGCGIDANIEKAGLALISAYNRSHTDSSNQKS